MSGTLRLDHKFLGDTPLFSGLAEAEMQRLLQLAAERRVAPGEVIVEEGSMGDSMFLLYSGTIEVLKRGPEGAEVQLACLAERGAFLGEMSLVDPGPRSATARAVDAAVLLELSLQQLESFFTDFPEARVVILRNIARVLARRLRQSNVLVASGQPG